MNVGIILHTPVRRNDNVGRMGASKIEISGDRGGSLGDELRERHVENTDTSVTSSARIQAPSIDSRNSLQWYSHEYSFFKPLDTSEPNSLYESSIVLIANFSEFSFHHISIL